MGAIKHRLMIIRQASLGEDNTSYAIEYDLCLLENK